MIIKPNFRNVSSGISTIFCNQNFILSGKAKYGNPSTTITIPSTHKKNSMMSLWKSEIYKLVTTHQRSVCFINLMDSSSIYWGVTKTFLLTTVLYFVKNKIPKFRETSKSVLKCQPWRMYIISRGYLAISKRFCWVKP